MKVVEGKFGSKTGDRTPLLELITEGLLDNGFTDKTVGKMFLVVQGEDEGFDTMLSNMTLEQIIYTLEVVKHNIITASSYLGYEDLH